MRAIVAGLGLMAALGLIVLSIRPGGLRRQLRLAARRLRLVLLLGGIYLILSGVIRIVFQEGWVADYGPAAIALVLGAAFLVMAQDPVMPPGSKTWAFARPTRSRPGPCREGGEAWKGPRRGRLSSAQRRARPE